MSGQNEHFGGGLVAFVGRDVEKVKIKCYFMILRTHLLVNLIRYYAQSQYKWHCVRRMTS